MIEQQLLVELKNYRQQGVYIMQVINGLGNFLAFCSFVAWDRITFQSPALYTPPAVSGKQLEKMQKMILENIIEICVAIDVAILGIAYPIIVEKTSNIGEKYSSNYISNVFNTEFPQRVLFIKLGNKQYFFTIFKLSLYITITSFLFLIFKFPPLFLKNNWFICNSANLIVLLLTIFLTIIFFIWLDKVVIYNGKSIALLKRIIEKYNKLKDDTETKRHHLKAINDLTYYALKNQDEHLQKTLLEFYHSVFSNIRKNHNKAQPLIYPVDLYQFVNKLVSEVIINENRRLLALEHRAVSGIWLLGEDFEDIEISYETYQWLWRNIYLMCDNEKTIKLFWANSNQYFEYRLKRILEDYDFKRKGINNQEEVEKRDNERKLFLEFHYALGGLLLYRKQYRTLKYIFKFSQSIPPRYALLPDNMTTIFKWFENFRNEHRDRKAPIDIQYYFPELDNLGNSREVVYWICSYLTILFIRQYSLTAHYTYQDFTSSPVLPKNVIELNNWLSGISYFDFCLKRIIDNKELIEELGYNEIIKNKGDELIEFVQDLEKSIKNEIGSRKLNAPLSSEKIKAFYESSNNIISNAFKSYDSIFNHKIDEIDESGIKTYVNGDMTIMTKSAFTDDDIPHLNFDSVFASFIVDNNVKRHIPSSFFISRTKRYLLSQEELIDGVLKVIGKNKNAIIIGISLGYEEINTIENSVLKSKLLKIPSTESRYRNTLFILDKVDLPIIHHKKISEEEIKELKLDIINRNLELYASVIDFNIEENKEIKKKFNLVSEEEKNEYDVLVSIIFSSIIYWKKERDVIQIEIASQFRERGLLNKINELEPLKSKQN